MLFFLEITLIQCRNKKDIISEQNPAKGYGKDSSQISNSEKEKTDEAEHLIQIIRKIRP